MLARVHRWPIGSATIAVALLALLGGTAYRSMSPERVLADGYGRALNNVDTSWGSPHAGNLWLSEAPATGAQPARGVAGGGALAVGDRITIAARAGGEEAILVTELEEIDGEGLGLSGMRFQIVTGRPVGAPDDVAVRFLFAVDVPGSAAGQARADRSL